MRCNCCLGAAIPVCGAVLLSSLGATTLHPRYNDGCQNCHGAFTDGSSPKGTVFPSDSKHEMHRGSSNMNADCNLCHTNGDNRNPFLGSSEGTGNTPAVGCTGCHGRDYGGAVGNSAVGLRAHHLANGIGTCAAAGCHDSDPPALPEDVLPVYYGVAVDSNVDDSCNAGPGFLENWSVGDSEGLDNDGDNAYDAADTDCVVACIGDITGDGITNISDLGQVLADFGCSGGGCVGDVNGDGSTNITDLGLVLGDFGCTP